MPCTRTAKGRNIVDDSKQVYVREKGSKIAASVPARRAKPIWLALDLPALPLQVALRGIDPTLARTLTLGVIDGPPRSARLAFCSARACAAGLVPGMQLACAQALVRDLLTVPRDPERERLALQDLACWAYQFSALIVPYARPNASGLLIETGASERLFGGRTALRRRILGGLRALGYTAADASAATPAAARLLAAARSSGTVVTDATEPEQLPDRIAALPLGLLGWSETITVPLRALGLQTIGALLALPRDAFARRFGTGVLLDLDRLLGRVADPQPPFQPPQRFQASIELPADLVHLAALTTPLQRLLLLLEGFLRQHQAGATALLLRAHHSPGRDPARPPTTVPLSLAAPERNTQRLLRLFTERLTRVRLAAPATVLELQLEHMAEFAPPQPSFLPPVPNAGKSATASDSSTLQLAELLHARLGSAGVFQLHTVSDHRPEQAYRLLPLSLQSERHGPAPVAAQRPLLILPSPHPLPGPAEPAAPPSYGGRLSLLAGPERIEAGWWDLGHSQPSSVRRDYFVARNPHGQTLWIYRELQLPQRWFLHGFFA